MLDLEFLQFQEALILDREHLAKADVSDLLESMLDELLGEDSGPELEPLERVRKSSARTLQRFVETNAGVVGAWCFANGVPDPWKEGSLFVVKRSEEHTSELQSLMRISYAVFCLKKKNKSVKHNNPHKTA